MNIDAEMKLWEERSNDEFGKLLKSIIELTNDYFAPDVDEDGMFMKNPLEYYATLYSVDGNRKYVFNAVNGILYNYDITGNDKSVESLLMDLRKLI